MTTTCRRVLALVGLMVGLSTLAAMALPGFSDQNIAAGNLNPTDTILVQQIRITRGASETVTLSSITVQNLGTAGDGDIDKITVMDSGDVLGETTAISGLASGITVNLGGFNMTSTTHYLKIYVTVGTAVDGGETVNLRARVHYVSNGSSYTSSWISDLTGETIRDGGFDEIEDASPDAGYMNPGDADVVQTTVFTDIDANGKPVEWQGVATDTPIILVENLGTAVKATDIAQVRVTVTIGGVEYRWDGVDGGPVRDEWGTWNPASPQTFTYGRFFDVATGLVALPASVADNGVLTVTVSMRITASTGTTPVDGRTIRTKTTIKVQEQGQDSTEAAVRYDQSSSSETTQTIRKQGFEKIVDESQSLGSGTAATGDIVVQAVRATDQDRNGDAVRAYRIYIRNTGSAEGAEINKIEVKAGATTLWTLNNSAAPHNLLPNFKTGAWYDFTLPTGTPWFDVTDDHEQVFKVYYTIGTPVDGHTLKPAVRLEGKEPTGGQTYSSDEVVYPDTVALYLPGFEFVENQTPPEGGVAYSGQRLLAQTIRVEDLDEDDDSVTVNPIVAKNIGTATSGDVTKVEVWRRNSLTATAVKLGETTDLSGFRTGGARVELTHDNVVTDAAGGAEAYLDIYLTIAEPEAMTAARTIQLETRVLHTENLQSFDKMAVSNQWTLETNHRPVVTITVAVAATASVLAKADFTYAQTIQFTGAATDSDGDAISAWHWDFGDGNTSDIQNPTHRYPNGGTFTATLTVTDARGVTGTATKTITVEGPPNVAPTVAFTWTPAAPASGATVTFTSTVTDPDQPTGTAFTYAWNFGDAATSTVANPTHAFAANQSYTVTLTVTDAQSGTGTVTHTVAVGNTAPVVTTPTASPTSPTTGDTVTFTATATDADDEDEIDFFTWDFGDGTVQTGSGTVTHTYAAPDTYTVTVTATDTRDAVSAEKTVDITVSGPDKVVVIAYPNPASTQATIQYVLPDGATGPILHVYQLDGKLVFETDLTEGASTYVWDLIGDNDEVVANGLYFCVVTATDEDGKTIRSETFRLLVSR
ncbi:MAG: PKD domain-containing protein [Thermotogota bacterium]